MLLAMLAATIALEREHRRDFSALQIRTANIENRVAKIEVAVKTSADAQGGKTKELVDDALAVAKVDLDLGDREHAGSALAVANKLIAERIAAKEALTPGVMENAAST